MVIAERRQRIDFRDAHDMRLVQSLTLKCKGVDHMEFTADGRYGIATCEFSGQLFKIDLETRAVIGYLNLRKDDVQPSQEAHRHAVQAATWQLRRRADPQDIRSSPDGSVFFVADMTGGGVILVDPIAFTRVGFIPTGIGTRGLYPSRDGTRL